MIIYQVLTRLWKGGTFADFNTDTFDYLKSLGITHIWYTGVPRHATGEPFVKGEPGSPYCIKDWFDVNPYLCSGEGSGIDQFKALVERTHAAGLKVITDFIPNHVAADCINPVPHHNHHDYDWTDTLKVRYPEATDFMTEVIGFWHSLGVDGFRCDMVELVPQDLWRHIKAAYPEVLLIGEAYDMANYRPLLDAGFDYLYDKSGLYDTLRAVVAGRSDCRAITSNWQRLSDLQPRMLNFLENHDEQRVASPWFAGSKENAYAALVVSALFYNCPFMLYFGQEEGENASDGFEGRTSLFDWSRKLDPKADEFYKAVLNLASKLEGTTNYDLCYMQSGAERFDAARHFAFLRFAGKEVYLFVCNFSGEVAEPTIVLPGGLARERVRLRVPANGAIGLEIGSGQAVRVL